MKKKNLAFTLAEVLIVIGIIGVVAALTLPNLNHATGDKETVTRLQKAYSILNEANDRAVAIYGPISTWSSGPCAEEFEYCLFKRLGEFIKISKSCDESGSTDSDTFVYCTSFNVGDFHYNYGVYQMPDGITFAFTGANSGCGITSYSPGRIEKDICSEDFFIDINGPSKGTNTSGQDIFMFKLSDSLGFIPSTNSDNMDEAVLNCMQSKDDYNCTFWPLEFGNLDYLKVDEEGKCPDSNIVLDGTTNTSCH